MLPVHCKLGLRRKRFRASSSRKLGWEQKRGEKEGKEENACPQTHDFEKLRSPTNAASDWRGAGSVDLIAINTSIKQGMYVRCRLACSRLSDSGEDAKEKGTQKVAALSQFSGADYLGAWNRLVADLV